MPHRLPPALPLGRRELRLAQKALGARGAVGGGAAGRAESDTGASDVSDAERREAEKQARRCGQCLALRGARSFSRWQPALLRVTHLRRSVSVLPGKTG